LDRPRRARRLGRGPRTRHRGPTPARRVNGGGECPRAAEAARGHADVPNVDPAPLGAAASWSPTGSPAQSTPAVAIVGGGASGALLAAQLLRQDHPAGARVILIERRFEVGRGVAYSTTHPDHR